MNARVLDWDGELTVYAVAGRWREARDAIADGDGLSLELGRVEEIDAAGVQLLMMLARAARCAGAALSVGAISPPVRDVLALLNIDLPTAAGGKEEA